MLQDALLARLDRRRAPIVDTRVITAARALMRTHGAMTVDAVARHAATSARHLERLFQEQIGTSPKRFARVLRFQSAASPSPPNTPAPAFADISPAPATSTSPHDPRVRHTAGTTPGNSGEAGRADKGDAR
jgi:methylphosphotriester-DNA--protein-cysteine methyltransferase